MPSPTVGTNQKAPVAQGSFFCGIDFSSAVLWWKASFRTTPSSVIYTSPFYFVDVWKSPPTQCLQLDQSVPVEEMAFTWRPILKEDSSGKKTASFLYFPQLWYLILSCFANCYRCCVNSIKVGQTPFFAAAPEAELAACLGQFSQSFQALRNKSSLPKGDSLRPFRVCT